MAHVRPKLDLKKRSEAAPSDINTPATASSDKPNPFGAAKPIDTLKREKEVEEKRAQLAAEKKAAEEKAREEKKAAAAAAAEAEAKAAEDAAAATTPTAEKKFENLRRGSAAPSEGEKPAAVEEKKIEKSRGPDNWRARTAVPPKEPIRRQNTQSRQQQQQQQQPAAAQEKEEQSVTPAAEPQEDGWNTVTKPKKRGGRA